MPSFDFSQLKVAKQYRPHLKPFHALDLIAYDTETIKGIARLICDSKGEFIYPNSIEDCLSFMTRKKYRGILGWFYNINYDVEACLKHLPEEEIRELAKFGEVTDYANLVDKVNIKLIDRKMLILSRHQHAFKYFDIGGFYKGGLNKATEKYLGRSKMDPEIDFKTATDDELEDWIRSDKAIEYCIQDAKDTEDLAWNFIKTLNEFGLFTQNFASPASIATHHFLTKCEIPTLLDVSRGKRFPVKVAYEAYKGGFIQTFKKGYFENIYLYDINSAYPYWISKLPDLTRGRLKTSIGKIPKNAFMGWMRVVIRSKSNGAYDPNYFNPVAVKVKKFNKNFYFGGTFRATITKLEYDILKNDFDIEIKEGTYWIPNKEIKFMYADEVNRLYDLKSKSKDDKNLYWVLKTILNGYYGKLIQKIPKKNSTEFDAVTGNLFNPFHASYITAGCRMQVYEFIKRHGPENLVAVMTDGIAFSKRCDHEFTKELGDWSIDMQGEGVFIGSGLYSIRSGDEIKTATRGFQLTKKFDFFNLLAQNLDNDKIEFPQTVRLTYREALRVKRFVDWNILEQGLKFVNINCDTKRIWAREFENCRDVLNNVIDSTPIFVSQD